MNRVTLLEHLKAATVEATKDLVMPASLQKGDKEQIFRSPDIHLMNLPDSKKAEKKAPYVIHRLITGDDTQAKGQPPDSSAIVRSICCVYNDDEQEGGLMLLNLMERMRIYLLKLFTLPGGQYYLDSESGIKFLIYQEETAPYYAGEMISTWKTPVVQKEVPL